MIGFVRAASVVGCVVAMISCSSRDTSDAKQANDGGSPPDVSGEDIVAIARSFPEGGGVNLKGTGTPEDVTFRGALLEPKGVNGTHCSGFTFAVVMRAALDRNLLGNVDAVTIRSFQREWYGAVKGFEEEQAPIAMAAMGIGRSVRARDAQPGDFLQLWRRDRSGHSAVFLDWIKREGKVIGVKYRSSQSTTGGIGDNIEYFSTSGMTGASVDPERFYVGRLNPPRAKS